jgi:hypothetical protein
MFCSYFATNFTRQFLSNYFSSIFHAWFENAEKTAISCMNTGKKSGGDLFVLQHGLFN